mmetsp:Transcript_79866/g.222403  ORF Transcript_79866/g.222403 Transcript_79866/m.222403 type:complete len:208 (+) Transcript_79866:1617-2240(+)
MRPPRRPRREASPRQHVRKPRQGQRRVRVEEGARRRLHRRHRENRLDACLPRHEHGRHLQRIGHGPPRVDLRDRLCESPPPSISLQLLEEQWDLLPACRRGGRRLVIGESVPFEPRALFDNAHGGRRARGPHHQLGHRRAVCAGGFRMRVAPVGASIGHAGGDSGPVCGVARVPFAGAPGPAARRDEGACEHTFNSSVLFVVLPLLE